MAGGLLVSIAIWTASALHRELTTRAGWRQLTVVGEPVSIASCLGRTCLARLARSRLNLHEAAGRYQEDRQGCRTARGGVGGVQGGRQPHDLLTGRQADPGPAAYRDR